MNIPGYLEFPSDRVLRKIIYRQELWILLEFVFCAASYSWGFTGAAFGIVCNFCEPIILPVIIVLSTLLSADKLFRFRKSKGAHFAAFALLAPAPFFLLNLSQYSVQLGLKARVHRICGVRYLQNWADQILSKPLSQLSLSQKGYNQPKDGAYIGYNQLPVKIQRLFINRGFTESPVTVYHPKTGNSYLEIYLEASGLGTIGLDIYPSILKLPLIDPVQTSYSGYFRSPEYYSWSKTMRVYIIN